MTGSLQVKGGTYYTVLFVDGKYKWRTTRIKTEGRNKKETAANERKAQLILAQRIEDASKENVVECNEYLLPYLESWMERKSHDIRRSTAEGYKTYYINHIEPFFKRKRIKLIEVTPMLIQQFVDKHVADGYSSSSIRKFLVVLSGAFDDAVRYNYIMYNPCERVRLPKMQKAKTNAYTEEQAKSLLICIKGDKIEPAVMLALYLGLRRSEVVGLRWQDIDFDNNVIHICNTIVHMTTLIEEENTKSKASRRDMPIPDNLRAYLLDLKSRSLGTHVCSDDTGKTFAPDYVSHRFRDVLIKNNLPLIRFHELRHTCGSLLINHGMSPKQVQEYLGHERVSTTLDFYVHLGAEKKNETSAAINSLLSN